VRCKTEHAKARVKVHLKTTGKAAAEATNLTKVAKSTGPTRKAVVKKLSK